MGKKKFALKAAIFTVLCFLIIGVLTPIFVPIWNPGTDTVKGFQQERENTIDALFLGTSRTAATASPWVLWDEYGISAYSLGVEQQPAIASSYLLEEALKTQKMQVVAIEVQGLNRERDYDAQEAPTRQNFDNMPTTVEKLKAAWEICSQSETQKISSFMFPFLRYHDRWNNLTEQSFINQNIPSITKGAVLSFNKTGVGLFPDDFPAKAGKPYELPEDSEYWLNEIIRICRENGVEVMLYAAPTYSWTQEQTEFYKKLSAAEENVHFIDFNSYYAMKKIGFDISEDFADIGGDHVNYFGARKMMLEMGKYMSNVLRVPNHKGEEAYSSWDRCVSYVEQQKQNNSLQSADDLTAYLNLLKDSGYTFAIAVCDDAASGMSWEQIRVMKKMGLQASFKTGFRKGYIALVDNGEIIYEKMKAEPLEYTTVIDEREWEISSVGFNEEIPTEATVTIDGVKYSAPTRGLFFVVYSKEEHKVIDTGVFDLIDGEPKVPAKISE